MSLDKKAKELGFCDLNFGCVSFNKRFVNTMDVMHDNLGKSIFQMFGSRSEAINVYRMFDNPKLSDEVITAAYKKGTKQSIIESEEKVILIAHDTTSLNYGSHHKIEGIGACYGSKKVPGFSVHSSIALTKKGVSLGMMSQITTTRLPDEYSHLTKTEKSSLKDSLPINEKFTYRWIQGIEESQKAVPKGVKAIHLCDREGDMYELLDMAHKNSISFIIRANYDRKDINGDPMLTKVTKSEVLGVKTVEIPRNSGEKIKPRKAKLEVRVMNIDIKIPGRIAKNKHLERFINVNVIYVSEIQEDKNIPPISWFLITTEKIETAEDAFDMVESYKHRWKIERFHYILKSGCRIENLQLRKASKLKTAITMLSLVALKVLKITYLGRVEPDASCGFF